MIKTFLLTLEDYLSSKQGEEVSDLTRGDLQGYIDAKIRRANVGYVIVNRDENGKDLNIEFYN
jgi:hypothetical protein